jgi:hypothetical protein
MEPGNNSINTMGPATPEMASAFDPNKDISNMPNSSENRASSIEQSMPAEHLSVDHNRGMPLPMVPAPVVAPIQVTAPTPQPTVSAPQAAPPALATDGNVIEKEWIDKVKQIISHTSNDPHAQQRQFSRLMADYILKRTGRSVGKGGE